MGTLPTDPKVVRAIRYSGFFGVRETWAPVGRFLGRVPPKHGQVKHVQASRWDRGNSLQRLRKAGRKPTPPQRKRTPPKNIPQQKQQVDWYHGNPENMLKTFIFWVVILLIYCYTVDGFRNPAPVLTANRISISEST